MKYLYTKKKCKLSVQAKTGLVNGQIKFVERNGDRLALDSRVFDNVDREAFLKLQQQNLTFPVEIDMVKEC